ncbi:MAG: hypothetical protein RAO94_04450 [Candidatus Stygibacter australis]|nr:hypothetical protein [Candidatus Stygibacter australis]
MRYCKIVILISLILVLTSCSSSNLKKNEEIKPKPIPPAITHAQIKMEEKNDKIRHEIEMIKADEEYYYGIDSADITETGYSTAASLAKRGAKSDLASKIKSAVKVEINRYLQVKSNQTGKVFKEIIEEEIEKKSNIYTDVVLENLVNETLYTDYPQKGVITCVIQKSKQEYNEKVTSQIEANINNIVSIIKYGNEMFSSGKYIAAVHEWVSARGIQENIFGKLPIQADIDDDEQNEDLTAYLNNRVNKFFDSIIISLYDEDTYSYDNQGILNRKPTIIANYKNEDGWKQSIAKLPLKANTVRGRVDMQTSFISGEYGQSELNIHNIDASYPLTTLKIEVDTDKIENIDKLPSISTLDINLQRMRTITISVSYKNGSSITTPRSLNQEIKSQVLSKGFSATEISITHQNLGQLDLNQINATNADIFLQIYLEADNASTVGGYNNMYVTSGQGIVSLYRMPQGILIASEPISKEEGFGASAENAGITAFGKLEPKVNKIVQQILNKL